MIPTLADQVAAAAARSATSRSTSPTTSSARSADSSASRERASIVSMRSSTRFRLDHAETAKPKAMPARAQKSGSLTLPPTRAARCRRGRAARRRRRA